MTTCVYCDKDIDEWGDYRNYDCPKLKKASPDDYICENCIHYIYGGKEVPAP